MIPLQLRVRNFMCYRDDVPPLDFDGIHLACLTGANGHGKSALLDAMTWALWGKARAKRDDELIHLGQSEMEVEFTFGLGGTVYRVLRKRDSSQAGPHPPRSAGAARGRLSAPSPSRASGPRRRPSSACCAWTMRPLPTRPFCSRAGPTPLPPAPPPSANRYWAKSWA